METAKIRGFAADITAFSGIENTTAEAELFASYRTRREYKRHFRA